MSNLLMTELNDGSRSMYDEEAIELNKLDVHTGPTVGANYLGL
jgi:hypothetical protein